MLLPPVVELRISGRVTGTSVLEFTVPLRRLVHAGRPFRVLFDRRELSAPTGEGRAALQELYREWDRVAALVTAWADVYDVRRATSLARARAARLERGEPVAGPSYPHRVFDDLTTARTWLETAGLDPARLDPARLDPARPDPAGRPRVLAAAGR